LVWAQLRSLRRADEFERVMQREAMAIGFGAVIVVALAGGSSTRPALATQANCCRSPLPPES
jgi:hypothetical protein